MLINLTRIAFLLFGFFFFKKNWIAFFFFLGLKKEKENTNTKTFLIILFGGRLIRMRKCRDKDHKLWLKWHSLNLRRRNLLTKSMASMWPNLPKQTPFCYSSPSLLLVRKLYYWVWVSYSYSYSLKRKQFLLLFFFFFLKRYNYQVKCFSSS